MEIQTHTGVLTIWKCPPTTELWRLIKDLVLSRNLSLPNPSYLIWQISYSEQVR